MPTPVSELVAAAKAAVTTLTADEVVRHMAENPGVLLVDVREPEEHAQAAIPGAVSIPRGLLEMKIATVCPDAARPMLVHCAAGGRAALAARTLSEMGYTAVCAVDAKFSDLQSALAGSKS